jgi:isopentenyl phosphate kinase
MDELILVKLGGSVITDKNRPFTEDMETIKRLAKEIHEARQEKKFRLIVGNGGGSYPHSVAAEYKTNEGIINQKSYEGLAKVQDAASRLNRIIVRELINSGENAVSINPSSCVVTESGEIKKFFLEPIIKLLDFDMVPVPYGDVVFDLKKGCVTLSTEIILGYIGKVLKKKYRVSRIIMCTNVNGIFTKDPNLNSDAELIQSITPKNIEKVKHYLRGSAGTDVTGGMVHKVKRMVELTKIGIETEIINAKKPNLLKRALLGETGLGTTIKKT